MSTSHTRGLIYADTHCDSRSACRDLNKQGIPRRDSRSLHWQPRCGRCWSRITPPRLSGRAYTWFSLPRGRLRTCKRGSTTQESSLEGQSPLGVRIRHRMHRSVDWQLRGWRGGMINKPTSRSSVEGIFELIDWRSIPLTYWPNLTDQLRFIYRILRGSTRLRKVKRKLYLHLISLLTIIIRQYIESLYNK